MYSTVFHVPSAPPTTDFSRCYHNGQFQQQEQERPRFLIANDILG